VWCAAGPSACPARWGLAAAAASGGSAAPPATPHTRHGTTAPDQHVAQHVSPPARTDPAPARSGRRKSGPISRCRAAPGCGRCGSSGKKGIRRHPRGSRHRSGHGAPRVPARHRSWQLVVEEVGRREHAPICAGRCCALPRCQGHIQPDPRQHHVAKGLQVGHGVGQRVVRDRPRPPMRRWSPAPTCCRPAPSALACAASAGCWMARSTVALMRRPAAIRPLPPSISTLRPSRSVAWMPWVPSWIMFRRLSRQYCSTGKSRV
jgi:hypothetical protein